MAAQMNIRRLTSVRVFCARSGMPPPGWSCSWSRAPDTRLPTATRQERTRNGWFLSLSKLFKATIDPHHTAQMSNGVNGLAANLADRLRLMWSQLDIVAVVDNGIAAAGSLPITSRHLHS
jgi:hypothetical protein